MIMTCSFKQQQRRKSRRTRRYQEEYRPETECEVEEGSILAIAKCKPTTANYKIIAYKYNNNKELLFFEKNAEDERPRPLRVVATPTSTTKIPQTTSGL